MVRRLLVCLGALLALPATAAALPAFPASPPVTQGAYTGVDFPGCDNSQAGGDGLCYTDANGGDARAEDTYPLLDNLKWVPYAIYQGTNDELVPTTGVTLNVKRLQDLGYRYRYYLFPGQEHYGPPVIDQWVEGADYGVDRVLEHHAADVGHLGRVGIAHEAVQPVDPSKGVARFDGRSLAIPDPARTPLRDAGPPAGPEQGYPYAMVGQQWLLGRGAPTDNGFQATLTGASAVTLHTLRMRIDDARPVSGQISTDSPLALTLDGNWPSPVSVTVDGSPATVQQSAGAIEVSLPSGRHAIAVTPG